jgi:hypothetical protein
MRIVNTDNFGGDYPNESFILWPMRKDCAEKIADALNENAGPHASRFYKVVENDYVLQPGFEP